MEKTVIKTKLCTERVIDDSLEEKEMSEKMYNPLAGIQMFQKEKPSWKQ